LDYQIKYWTKANSWWRQLKPHWECSGSTTGADIIFDPYHCNSTAITKYWPVASQSWLNSATNNSVYEWVFDWTPIEPMPGQPPGIVHLPDMIEQPWQPTAPQILVPKGSPEAKAAKERARALLKSVLTPSQWLEYEEHGTITISSQSGRRYRLDNRTIVRNITRLDDEGQVVEFLCCHPTDDLPVEDVLLTQKLHLECAEESFRKTANITPQRRTPLSQALNRRSGVSSVPVATVAA